MFKEIFQRPEVRAAGVKFGLLFAGGMVVPEIADAQLYKPPAIVRQADDVQAGNDQFGEFQALVRTVDVSDCANAQDGVLRE